MKPLRAVLFDLDGTIADSEPHIATALVAALDEFGYEVTREAAVASLGPPMAGMLNTLLGPLPAEKQHEIRETYLRHYRMTIHEVRPMPGAEQLLDELTERGVSIAVVTNKGEDSALEQIEAMGWMQRFGAIVGWDTAPRPKPAADPALLALKALRVEPVDAAFVGDTPTDAACGRAAGIATIIGLTRLRSENDIREAGATHLCADLLEAREVLLAQTSSNGARPA